MEYTLTGDLTGGGSATINTTITGLKGHQLPELSTGVLKWNGTSWEFSVNSGIPETYLAVINTNSYNTAYLTNFAKMDSVSSVLVNRESCFNSTTKYYTCKATGVYKVTMVFHYGDVSTRSLFQLFKNDVSIMEIYDEHNPQWMDSTAAYYLTVNTNDTLMVARATAFCESPYETQICIEKIA